MKQSLFVVLGILAIASDADAQQFFYDGPSTATTGACGEVGAGEPRTMLTSKTGYVVDLMAEIPKLHQPVFIHAFASNTGCTAVDRETVSFELIELPPGARFATASELPMGVAPLRCFVSGGAAATLCPASPQSLTSGGWLIGAHAGLLPGMDFEVQVAVVFDQVLSGEHIRMRTKSNAKPAGVDSFAWVIAPWQPWLPSGKRGDDLALLGSSFSASPAEAWTLPVAFSNDDGSFTVNNYPVGAFADWARTPNVQRLSGDFNNDGRTDFALVGGAGWNTIPVAMSNGNGRFTVTNHVVGTFGFFASLPGVKALTGDFDRDGDTDIALVGGGMAMIPLARAAGNGFFHITTNAVTDFGGWASGSGVTPIAGDFNGDRMTDIALIGGGGWRTLPVAFSYGNGSFDVANLNAETWGVATDPFGIPSLYPWSFAASAREPGVKPYVGDFNKDGFDDIALVGGTWGSIRLAKGSNQRTWFYFDSPASNFAAWARSPGVKVLVGDYNKDGYSDLALTGAVNWATVPVASGSTATGHFTVTNQSVVMGGVGNFAEWASWPGVRAVAGDFNGDGFSDIALTGGSGWGSIPVALGVGYGNFAIINRATNRFPAWATDGSATLFRGRMN